MKLSARWWTAVLFLLLLSLTACASGGTRKPIDWTKIPIQIVVPPVERQVEKPVEQSAPLKVGTLAVVAIDRDSKAGIAGATIQIIELTATWHANDDGYAAREIPQGPYTVTVEAEGYYPRTVDVMLTTNELQVPVTLARLRQDPAPVPVAMPPTPTVSVIQPMPVTPVVTPTVQLCAMRDSDPLGCVRQVAAVYPHLLVINTYASTVEFTQRVLEVLGDPWGHVGKTRGEGQAVPRGFVELEVQGYRITGVSHDAIKHRLTGQVVDILGNATANEPCPAAVRTAGKCWPPGPANIIWDEVPPHDWRPENPFVPAVPVQP